MEPKSFIRRKEGKRSRILASPNERKCVKYIYIYILYERSIQVNRDDPCHENPSLAGKRNFNQL